MRSTTFRSSSSIILRCRTQRVLPRNTQGALHSSHDGRKRKRTASFMSEAPSFFFSSVGGGRSGNDDHDSNEDTKDDFRYSEDDELVEDESLDEPWDEESDDEFDDERDSYLINSNLNRDEGFLIANRGKAFSKKKYYESDSSDDESGLLFSPRMEDSPLVKRLQQALEDEDDFLNDEEKAKTLVPPVHTILDVRVMRLMRHYAIVQPIEGKYSYKAGILPREEILQPNEDDEQEKFDFHSTSQYWGDVHSIRTDLDDDDIPMDLLLEVGSIVRAIVCDIRKKDQRVVYSLRMVPPELPESFQPQTLMVFRLPLQMSEDELHASFSRFGPVLNIELLDVQEEEFPHLRALTKVTMEHKADAEKLIETLSGAKIPYDVEGEDGTTHHQFFRIGIEVAHDQTYRERLQKRLTAEHQMKIQEWIADSEMERMDIMAKRSLVGLIPEYDYWV